MRIAANIFLSFFLLIGTSIGGADCSTCPMAPVQATCHGDKDSDPTQSLAAPCCCARVVDDRAADEYDGLTEVRAWRVNAAATAGLSVPWEIHQANGLLLQMPVAIPHPRSVALYRLKSSYLI